MFVEALLLLMGGIIIALSVLLVVTLRNGSLPGEGLVTVLVLGDIGRSPRMKNHSICFAKNGYHVQHVGYGGTKPERRFANNRNIDLFYVRDTPEFHKYLPKLVAYGVKVLWQSSFLLWTLCQTKKSSHLILQNPPAIPTLAIAWLFCLFRCTRLLIDWHNYGYSILALALRSNHPLVRFSRWYEEWFGQLAFWGFCVTQAMQDNLEAEWNIRRTDVLYDRASDAFKPLDAEEKHKLFMRLSKDIPAFRGADSSSTAFSTCQGEEVSLLHNRPALLISSTSWTEDEDFSILLKALDFYDSAASKSLTIPQLICVITGKGPQKEHYKKVISERNWVNVSVYTPWLESEDYPKLLGSADLGVCLHYSSSGLDLPMKVVDMFGAGLPVCAVDFKCLSELVKHEENGLVFKTSEELCQQIISLLERTSTAEDKMKKFRENLKSFQEETWLQHWESIVLPVLSR